MIEFRFEAKKKILSNDIRPILIPENDTMDTKYYF